MLQKNFTTVVMEESMNKQSGFTLIELLVQILNIKINVNLLMNTWQFFLSFFLY